MLGDNYLEHILHCDIHFQVLLTVGLESVVGEAVVVRCCKEVSIHPLRNKPESEGESADGKQIPVRSGGAEPAGAPLTDHPPSLC